MLKKLCILSMLCSSAFLYQNENICPIAFRIEGIQKEWQVTLDKGTSYPIRESIELQNPALKVTCKLFKAIFVKGIQISSPENDWFFDGKAPFRLAKNHLLLKMK